MRGDAGVIERIKSHSPADLALSTIPLAEIWYGIEQSARKKKERKNKIDQVKATI